MTVDLSVEQYFRAVILYGRNVATYKFALGKSLLALALEGQSFVPLDQLAEPFADALLEHLRLEDKQSTAASSAFLTACRQHLDGQIARDELLQATVRLGFVNVIDAFHVVGNAETPVRFFDDDRRGRGGIILTDHLLSLPTGRAIQHDNLRHEVEARWRLVETAWSLNLPPRQLQVRFDEQTGDLSVVAEDRRRRSVTQARYALDGYQSGRCFYCRQEISLEPATLNAEVDHVFPWVLPSRGLNVDIDGIWNLVLACTDCNRGQGGKFAALPATYLIERLHQRNEGLIASNHPLRETLMNQTGMSEIARRAFITGLEREALPLLIHRWEPNGV